MDAPINRHVTEKTHSHRVHTGNDPGTILGQNILSTFAFQLDASWSVIHFYLFALRNGCYIFDYKKKCTSIQSQHAIFT